MTILSKHWSATIVAISLVANGSAIADESKTTVCVENRDALLALDAKTFDRTIGEGWRTVAAKEGCQLAAADLIAEYRETKLPSEDLRSGSSLIWHEGQARAMGGQTEAAIIILAQARRSKIDNSADTAWNLYVDATIAFLKQDRMALDQTYAELSALPEPDYWAAAVENTKEKYGFTPVWPNNINVVEAFQRCFEKPYSEAYSRCNEGLGSDQE
ncbi:MAG: hypothetical protein AAFV59_09485 [Pseudomonadota bacterium]